jgi:pSer/pThr/pTyr-binding forkhead associated (FHA) protein
VPYLIVSLNGKEVQRRKLEGVLDIGRSLECDIAIEDPAISRHHCRVEPDGDKWTVIDLQSRNGTRVNKIAIERQVLKEGDVISFGHAKAAFHTGKFVPPRPADPAAAMLSESGAPVLGPRQPPSKTLPTPRIGRVDTVILPAPDSEKTPLPFTRPPARPIVKPQEGDEE